MTRRLPSAAAGVASGAAAIGAGELVAAGVLRTIGSAGTPSPLVAVGAAFVDLTPAPLKDWAVATFGAADKVALFVGMGLILVLVCALLGALADARPGVAPAGIVGLAAVAVAAVATRPGASWSDALPAVVAGAVGSWVLGWLLERARTRDAEDPTRRGLLLGAAALTGLGVLGLVLGRVSQRVVDVARRAREIVVPAVTEPVAVPAAAHSVLPGQTPYLTPNDAFYRIDTALVVPQVDPEEWTLRVTGLVERELTITFAELVAEDLVEALVTLTCVSNEVGGNLAGNAVWTGLPVRHVLDRAGVLPEADMVLSSSVDGWTAGTPLEALMDERNALLAIGMNGEPLPAQHGFPARLVVPGLYGYVSATKWVTELKVTRFDADEGYWTPRGWAELGPIKTASRIDVPRGGATVPAGEVVLGGVAWAQTRGVAAVEVSVDEGPWREAELRAEPSVDSWRLWSTSWDVSPGDHDVRVRAVDGDGAVQTESWAPPAPDGSSGWHAVRFRAE